jgi:hypothetical protein
MPSFRHVALALVLAGVARADVPTPTVAGPIPGQLILLGSTTFPLAEVGYVAEEYFVSGTARAYTASGAPGLDGMWAATPTGATADYTTRIVVYRPTERRKFHGTVVVEWLNVSGGLDAPPDWATAHTQLIRNGWAWVGVSAQIVGVEGGTALLPIIPLPLKTIDPVRYGPLHHPGDSFSYDMYSQVAQAIRAHAGPDPLGGLRVKRVLAAGESQSAFRLVTYVNAVHADAHVFDGYLVHSRGAISAAPLSEPPQPAIPTPARAPIRSDVDVPVLILETESDLTVLDYVHARQDDSRHVRVWEVAGTAHYDAYGLVQGLMDRGDSPDVVAPLVTSAPIPGVIECPKPINAGPMHFAANAAFAALERWVRTGKAPKPAPRLEVSDGPPVTIAVDEHGNARGGIRTPAVDVPIARFTGVQAGGSLVCLIFGTTTLFDQPTLSALYPTPKAFLKPYRRSLKRALKNGWVTRADGKLMRRWAAGSGIGG